MDFNTAVQVADLPDFNSVLFTDLNGHFCTVVDTNLINISHNQVILFKINQSTFICKAIKASQSTLRKRKPADPTKERKTG